MRPQLVVLPQAQSDLLDCAEYLRERNAKVAHRFLRSARATLNMLAGMPEMAARYEFLDESLQTEELADLRVWQVRHYPRFLIFYRPIRNGIEVLRVVDGYRDYERLLRF